MAIKKRSEVGRIRVNVYLEPAQKSALERLTKTTRVPWSEYLREGVDMVLAKYRKQMRRS